MKKLISVMLAMIRALSCALCALAEPIVLPGGLNVTVPDDYIPEQFDETGTYTWSKDKSAFAVQVIDLDEYAVILNLLGADYLLQLIASNMGELYSEVTAIDMGKDVTCYAFTYNADGIETGAAMLLKGAVIYVLGYMDLSGASAVSDMMRNEILVNWVSFGAAL